MHALNATLYHNLGLADRGAAEPDSTGRDLLLGDLDRFVGLGVWPQRDPLVAAELGHRSDVALHRVEIDAERRRVEQRTRARLADQRFVRA